MPEAIVIECARVVGESDEMLARSRICVVDTLQAANEERDDRIEHHGGEQQRRGQYEERAEGALGEVFACRQMPLT
jgi:hypothetical protein